MTFEYRIHDFHPTTGYYLLDWDLSSDPAGYTKSPMPGWLTMIKLEVEHPGGDPYPTVLQHHYPRRRLSAARMDEKTGRLAPAESSPYFYRILAPGESEPPIAEVKEAWHVWMSWRTETLSQTQAARPKGDPTAIPALPKAQTTATVIGVKPSPSTASNYLVTVDCPYCPNTHTHGVPKDEGYDPGHRIPHCPSPYAEQHNPAYRLVIPKELFDEYF